MFMAHISWQMNIFSGCPKMADILSTRNTPVLCDDFKIIIEFAYCLSEKLGFYRVQIWMCYNNSVIRWEIILLLWIVICRYHFKYAYMWKRCKEIMIFFISSLTGTCTHLHLNLIQSLSVGKLWYWSFRSSLLQAFS